MFLTNEQKENIEYAETKYSNTRRDFEKTIIKEIKKLVDDNHVLELTENAYFINYCTNETETIHTITTDGNELFISSGEQYDVFFIANEYGELNFSEISEILCSDSFEIVEKDWIKLL